MTLRVNFRVLCFVDCPSTLFPSCMLDLRKTSRVVFDETYRGNRVGLFATRNISAGMCLKLPLRELNQDATCHGHGCRMWTVREQLMGARLFHEEQASVTVDGVGPVCGPNHLLLAQYPGLDESGSMKLPNAFVSGDGDTLTFPCAIKANEEVFVWWPSEAHHLARSTECQGLHMHLPPDARSAFANIVSRWNHFMWWDAHWMGADSEEILTRMWSTFPQATWVRLAQRAGLAILHSHNIPSLLKTSGFQDSFPALATRNQIPFHSTSIDPEPVVSLMDDFDDILEDMP